MRPFPVTNALIRITWTVLACIVLVLIAAIGLMQTDQFRSWAMREAVEMMEEKEGLYLRIDELSGFIPWKLTGRQVSIADAEGVWLRAQEVSIKMDPWALLQRRVLLRDVQIHKLRWDRTAKFKENEPQPSKWRLDIARIRATDAVISQDLLERIPDALKLPEQSPSLSIDGHLTSQFGSHMIRAELLIKDAACDDCGSLFRITSERNLKGIHRIDFLIEEPPTGLISRGLALPGEPTVAFSGKLSAPIETWRAWMEEDLSHQGEIEGFLQLLAKPRPGYLSQHTRLLFKDQLTIKSAVRFRTDRSSHFTKAQAKGYAAAIMGDLSLDREGNVTHSDLAVTGDLSKLSPALPSPLSGNVSGMLKLKGRLSTPELDGTVTASSIEYQQHVIPSLEVRFQQLAVSPEKINGRVAINGQIDSLPISIDTLLDWEQQGAVDLNELALTIGNSRLDGTVSLLMPSWIVSGELQVRSDDISRFPLPEASEFSGRVEGTLLLQPDIAADKSVVQGLEAKLEVYDLSYQQVQAARAHVVVDMTDPFKAPKGKVQLQMEAVETPHLSWNELALMSEIGDPDQMWKFSLSSNLVGQLPWTLESKGSWNPYHKTVELEKTLVSLGKERMQLERPVTLVLDPSQPQVSPLEFRLFNEQNVPQGSAHAYISSGPDHLQVHVAMDALPLELLRGFDRHLPLSGMLFGAIDIEGRGTELNGDLEIHVVDLTLSEEENSHSPPLQGDLSAHLGGGKLVVEGSLDSPEARFMDLQLVLPIDGAARAPEDFLLPGGALKGHMEVQGSLAQVLQLLFVDTHRFEAETTLQLTLSGTVEEPKLEGRVTLSNGVYESLRSGTTLKDITCVIHSEGQDLLLEELSANDGVGGKAFASGKMRLDPYQGFPYTIRGTLDRTRLLQVDYARVISSGEFELTGTLYEGHLSGSLDVDESSVSIPKQIAPAIPRLNYVYLNPDPKIKNDRTPITRQVEFPLSLDLQLKAPGNVTISGRGLSSKWAGEVQLSGTTATPLVHGSMKMKEGTFEFSGRTFTITQGTLLFNGDPKEGTTLDVAGELDQGDLTIIVLLKGPLTNPKVGFYSNPSLPDREILSRVLFNKSSADITPGEGVQLAQTMVKLSGGGGGTDVLGEIRRTIGLDRLDISTSQENEVSVEAGKYISRGVFVSLSKSVNSEASRVAIEAELTRRFKVAAETGTNSESKIGLKWKQDY